MFYKHNSYINNKKHTAYVYRNGQYQKVLNQIWVDPVPLMVIDSNGYSHLYTYNNEGFIVTGGYQNKTASRLLSLIDNKGNLLIDSAGNELVGFYRGEN